MRLTLEVNLRFGISDLHAQTRCDMHPGAWPQLSDEQARKHRTAKLDDAFRNGLLANRAHL